MLSRLFSGMHRYTRMSQYVSRKKMKQTIRTTRPGTGGFDFTGDNYPRAEDWLPVEATRAPRNYMQPASSGGVNDAVADQVGERLPVFSHYGVRMGVAIPMLVVFAMLLCAIWIGVYSGNAQLAGYMAQQEAGMTALGQTAITLESEIAMRCSGINVRQEATRIGLKSSRGMEQEYVSVPDGVTVDPAAYGLRQNMATVFGQ